MNNGSTPFQTSSTCPTKARTNSIRQHGFALIDEDIIGKQHIEALRKGIECLHAHRLPASFVLLFDETWELANASEGYLRAVCPQCDALHMDVLAFCIESSGFSPHRDRSLSLAFDKDHNPLFVTHWIALSDATPTNSCIYVIPAEHDPGYWKGDEEDCDPMQRALPDKNAFPKAIRAVPRRQGQSMLFSQRLIHWGSARCQDSNEPPRMAISFVATQQEASYLAPCADINLFSTRLALVCGQMVVYYQRFEPTMDFLHACHEVSQQATELSDSYREKVHLEYLKACQERGEASSDQEEELMEAMLENQDDFDDDFNDDDEDDMEGTDDSPKNDISPSTAKRPRLE